MPDLFDEARERTLRAALDRLIPEDDYPGAWEAGCGEYIQRQLTGQLAHLVEVYRAGLDGIEAEGVAQHRQSFADLPADQQDEILRRIETGTVAAQWFTPPDRFFATLLNHAAEGYYANPAQGGNRDRTSWRMIGFNGR